MNFKRNCLIITSLLACVFMVTSCGKDKGFTRYQFIEEVVDTHEDFISPDGSYSRLGNYKSYRTYNKKELGSAYEVMTKYSNKKYMKSTGDQKLLVVPVCFPDYTCYNLGIDEGEYVDKLNKVFFGTTDNNQYVSVSQYYNLSSYGKLRISGKVVDKFYTFSYPVSSIIKGNLDRNNVANSYLNVLNWYTETLGYDDLDSYRIDDTLPATENNVAVYMVYCYPTELNTSNLDFFWNYTFLNKPLSWASYSALNATNGNPDSHVLIHETGHLLGLKDYYPSNKETAPEPTARIDMMDSNIGDHSSFSKMYLDWLRPIQVQNSCEITISSLTNKGDVILINDKWNGTVFDEYYLVEFYTPTDLNFQDSSSGNSLAVLPNMPGVKIFHVDARLGYFESKTGSSVRDDLIFKGYCNTDVSTPDGKNIDFAHDNSTYPDASRDEPYKKNFLYELKLNNVDHPISACAKNVNLYRPGDKISTLTFNSQNITNYTIEVTRISYRDASIKFTKVA